MLRRRAQGAAVWLMDLMSRRTAGPLRKWNLKTLADLARLAHVFEPAGRCGTQHGVH
jgi:hypothetical protein